MIATYAIYLKAPLIFNNFKFQDQLASDFTVKTLDGTNFNLNVHSKKIIIVFWATWCGPCEAELNRLNKMIMERKIHPTDVLAIAGYEDEAIVRKEAQNKNYLFNIGIDNNGAITSKYQVSAPPTIVFVDEKRVINWMTTGMSPTLNFRVTSFLK